MMLPRIGLQCVRHAQLQNPKRPIAGDKVKCRSPKRMTGQANFGSAIEHIDQTFEHVVTTISGLAFDLWKVLYWEQSIDIAAESAEQYMARDAQSDLMQRERVYEPLQRASAVPRQCLLMIVPMGPSPE
ncbi:uncharacterized protein M437DRAFT_69841 [Aureobasidium melanogenum CBS 110374]|uniref:Uncharacterized protein n=1 Tax=Aureobasidium melanogenum (strain CBS 110374) TaxID=1043003 RepID=A0A074VCQ6_AURM1|nr:uncharacterized protein M437DRAFT_69841 [Aureobasidium melanogenum CBS 110374]KEQ58490.1 hypothetical protein M437DRAFT_69841 [Aureobasidium melanogenum CBS 110374]